MNQPSIAVIWNPSKCAEEDLRSACASALERRKIQAEVAWLQTSREDSGQDAAGRALDAGCNLLIVAGGDGTVRAVAERVAGTGVELGIVPLGTGNLLARNLGVPLGNIARAFRRALKGPATAIDMGWVEMVGSSGEETHGFTVMVGFGIDAQMLAETDDDLKDKAGWLAYVEAMGRAMAASPVVDFAITLDDGSAREVSGHTLLVGNCGTIQGGITLLPDADPSDGQLDLLLVSADGVGAWIGTLKSFAWDNGVKRFLTGAQTAESSGPVEHLQATKLRVELPGPQQFELDGDEVGEVTAFTVTIQPGALLVR
jgi:diacylglycerol kinase (ATP)